jgi:hypothetical protein
MATATKPAPRERVLEVYAESGASAAAAIAGVSKRTVQRWAAAEEIESGYEPKIIVPCPSAAAYARGCRCDGCKEANRDVQRAIKSRRIARFKSGVTKIKHGVSGYSNWDCRCPDCRSAWSEYLRERRKVSRKDAKKGKSKKS